MKRNKKVKNNLDFVLHAIHIFPRPTSINMRHEFLQDTYKNRCKRFISDLYKERNLYFKMFHAKNTCFTLTIFGGQNGAAVTRPHGNMHDVGSNPAATRKTDIGRPPYRR